MISCERDKLLFQVNLWDKLIFVLYFAQKFIKSFNIDNDLCLQQVHGMKVFATGACLFLMLSGFSYAEDDLEDLLAYARNEIFARHGRTFTDPVYQKYFEQFDWYSINNNYSDDLLTDADRRDIRIILRWERELPNLSVREKTYLREIIQTMSKYRYLSEGFSIEKKEDITGDGRQDLLKTSVQINAGEVLCNSEVISNNKIIWKESLTDPYLGLGKSSLFNPDESDIWVRFYIASKYAAPKIISITEYEHISIDFASQLGLIALKEIGYSVSKSEYIKYLENYKGELIDHGEPEGGGELLIWYAPAEKFITYYAP